MYYFVEGTEKKIVIIFFFRLAPVVAVLSPYNLARFAPARNHRLRFKRKLSFVDNVFLSPADLRPPSSDTLPKSGLKISCSHSVRSYTSSVCIQTQKGESHICRHDPDPRVDLAYRQHHPSGTGWTSRNALAFAGPSAGRPGQCCWCSAFKVKHVAFTHTIP